MGATCGHGGGTAIRNAGERVLSNMENRDLSPAMTGKVERNMKIIAAYNRLKEDPSITNLPKAIEAEVNVSASTVRNVLLANGLLETKNTISEVQE